MPSFLKYLTMFVGLTFFPAVLFAAPSWDINIPADFVSQCCFQSSTFGVPSGSPLIVSFDNAGSLVTWFDFLDAGFDGQLICGINKGNRPRILTMTVRTQQGKGIDIQTAALVPPPSSPAQPVNQDWLVTLNDGGGHKARFEMLVGKNLNGCINRSSAKLKLQPESRP